MGLFENECRPSKTDLPERVLVFPLSPPSRPGKPSTTYPKRLPIKNSFHQYTDPEIDPISVVRITGG
jgi:hypothetical protein